MATKYYFAQKDPSHTAPSGLTPALDGGLSGTFATNPIFNFDQSFLDGLNGISAPDMGRSVPYISLKVLDPAGQPIEDLNLSFFHKPFSAQQISSDLRYSERPVMSLKSLELKTDLASGYLYYTNVVLNLTVHRPDALGSTFLVALLFPGMPFLLEYGWNSPNTLLDTKDVLLMAVKTYNLTMDASGQIQLTVEGTAFNERFNNVLIGDVGSVPTKSTTTNKEMLDGLEKYRTLINELSSYLQDMRQRSNSTINDYSLLKKFADSYQSVEKKSRGDLSAKLTEKLRQLNQSVELKNFGTKNKQIPTVKLHTLLHKVCHETFQALGGIMTGVSELRVVYGFFNEKAGPYANKCIAEFPIDLRKFRAKMKAGKDNGRVVPTIEFLLNTLQSDFLENEEYFKAELTQKQANNPDHTADIFNKPDVVSHFISRREGGNLVMELYIVDINSGLPITTNQLASTARATQADAEQAIIGSTGFPMLKLGHANSYIKTITLSQIADQNMKAVLIERMTRDRISGPRSKVTQKDRASAAPVTPLSLPLQGTASVIGHPGWKPFRAFYLSAGFFLIDGVYKITSVKHTLGADGFNTEIEFLWH